MGYSIKTGIRLKLEDCKVVYCNVVEFLDAVFLGVVSGFAIYTYYHTIHRTLWSLVLGLSGVAIALQAFILLAKHFAKKG